MEWAVCKRRRLHLCLGKVYLSRLEMEKLAHLGKINDRIFLSLMGIYCNGKISKNYEIELDVVLEK